MGAGKVAPAPLIWAFCAATVAPARTATARTPDHQCLLMRLSPSKIQQRVHGDQPPRRLRRAAAVDPRVVDVEEQGRRDVALVREPVGDAGNRSVALSSRN